MVVTRLIPLRFVGLSVRRSFDSLLTSLLPHEVNEVNEVGKEGGMTGWDGVWTDRVARPSDERAKR